MLLVAEPSTTNISPTEAKVPWEKGSHLDFGGKCLFCELFCATEDQILTFGKFNLFVSIFFYK